MESFLQKNHLPVITEYFSPSGLHLLETHPKLAYAKKGFSGLCQMKGAETVLAAGRTDPGPAGGLRPSLPCSLSPHPHAGPGTVSSRLTPSRPDPPAAKATSFLLVSSPESQNRSRWATGSRMAILDPVPVAREWKRQTGRTRVTCSAQGDVGQSIQTSWRLWEREIEAQAILACGPTVCGRPLCVPGGCGCAWCRRGELGPDEDKGWN